LRFHLFNAKAVVVSRPFERQASQNLNEKSFQSITVQWTQQKRQESRQEYVQQVLPLILGSLQPTAPA